MTVNDEYGEALVKNGSSEYLINVFSNEELKKGDKVTVTFDINGREWNGKYFVNLAAWKIETSTAGTNNDDAPPPFDPADEILDEEPPF